MGDFSQSPLQVLLDNLGKGYVGVHVEQGKPVLDRDLNLLHDLVAATVRSVISQYVGSGVSIGRAGFVVEAIPADNDFVVRTGPVVPGTCLVGGIEVRIEADTDYSAQPAVPALSTPDNTQPDPRIDIVYLDVALREVGGDEDTDLRNDADVGVQTSVRQQPAWVVRVAEGVSVPAPEPGHAHYPLARLTRPRNEAEIGDDMIEDLREPMSTLPDVERRLRTLETLLLLPAFGPPGSQISPIIGTTNTLVTLSGTNFNVGGDPEVLFGTTPATLEAPATATEVQVRVPAGLAPGPTAITIITASGQAVSDDTFTVLDLGGGDGGPPAPAFAAPGSQISPVIGTTNTLVTLAGTNFDAGGAAVQLGATPAPLQGVPTATQIQFRVPAAAPNGPATVTVTTDGGSVTSDDTFTVI